MDQVTQTAALSYPTDQPPNGARAATFLMQRTLDRTHGQRRGENEHLEQQQNASARHDASISLSQETVFIITIFFLLFLLFTRTGP
ncbi:hypothetical protein BJX63DRAFT_293199 [Aspergillus granulosus]|uniref:Uncharacterized protein n=1 Tax=Aspergillus granulosus TaxID=176169 RepID=A0ABR4H6P5_9EURO